MRRKTTITILLYLCTILSMQARCTMSNTSGNNNSYDDEQGTVVQYEGKQYIRVTNAHQFLRSFISGKDILVARHTEINLSPVLEDESWWKKNNYHFRWQPAYSSENLTGQNIVSEKVNDGRQLVVVGYKNINIVGEGNSRIVVEPRYAFCLHFVNCENITIRNLTIGHTEDGYCEGGVVGVTGGKGISIQNSELYGCGTYGLELRDTRNFTMYDSGIHDCTYGIMVLKNVTPAQFERCNFYRNREFTLVEGRNSDITFNDCRFYANNETSPLFDIDRMFNLNYCIIQHPTDYLGNIDQAQQQSNWISNNPYDTAGIGFGAEPFMGKGFGKEAVRVIYKGSKPTIVDFVNSILYYWDNSEEENGCYNWAEAWKVYQQTKQTDKGITFIIDERNGYARIESKQAGSNDVLFYDFCLWNCADGKHKLIAFSNGLLENGKAVETECIGSAYFYLYDNATNTITDIGFENDVFGGRPEEGGLSIVYLLPRTGKDITYVNDKGKRGIVKWNGNGFSIMKPITALPKTAERMDAKGQYAVYINKEDEDVSSVWLVDEQAKTVEKVCVTDPQSCAQWARMMKQESDAVTVPLDNIASAENAWIVGDGRKIIVEGCLDQRNSLTYIIDVDTHRAWQLPSQDGVVSINGEKKEIIVATYSYDDEGRYSYNRAYSTEGKFLRMVGNKERE